MSNPFSSRNERRKDREYQEYIREQKLAILTEKTAVERRMETLLEKYQKQGFKIHGNKIECKICLKKIKAYGFPNHWKSHQNDNGSRKHDSPKNENGAILNALKEMPRALIECLDAERLKNLIIKERGG